MDSVPATPHIWMWTLGEAAPDTIEQFAALTREGECDWIIIPLQVARVADLTMPPGYRRSSREDSLDD